MGIVPPKHPNLKRFISQWILQTSIICDNSSDTNKVSVLKPDAPEFVPKPMKAVSVKSTASTNIETGANRQPEMAQLKLSDRMNLDGAVG